MISGKEHDKSNKVVGFGFACTLDVLPFWGFRATVLRGASRFRDLGSGLGASLGISDAGQGFCRNQGENFLKLTRVDAA